MMNPIFASSALRRMRSMRTVVILTVYGALMLAFAILSSLAVLGRQTMTIGSMRQGIEYYVFSVVLQFLMILMVAPGMTAGSIAGERERQTLDLILVTQTGAFSIALGKLMESFSFVALILFSSLPAISVVLLFGGVSVLQVMMVFLFMLVSALGALSIGLLASTIFKRSTTATVVSYLAVFAVGIITLVPLGFESKEMSKLMSDISNGASLDMNMLLAAIPKIVLVNPGVGLLALLAGQTGMLERTFGILPWGYYYYQIMDEMNFTIITWINMGIVFSLSLILTFISALLIRPRSGRVRKSRKVNKEMAA